MNIKRFPQIDSNIFKYEMVSHHIAAKNHCTALHGLRQKLRFMVSKVLAPLHRPSFSAQLTPLATHWTLQLYGPSSHTLTVCWETRSLWVSQDSASPGSRCTACLCSGLSCQGSFYSEQPQKTEILPCLPWSMNKQADHHYKRFRCPDPGVPLPVRKHTVCADVTWHSFCCLWEWGLREPTEKLILWLLQLLGETNCP